MEQTVLVLGDADNSMVTARGKGGGNRRRLAKGRKRGQRDFAWGSGSTVQCADAVLLSLHLKPVLFCESISPQ